MTLLFGEQDARLKFAEFFAQSLRGEGISENWLLSLSIRTLLVDRRFDSRVCTSSRRASSSDMRCSRSLSSSFAAACKRYIVSKGS